MKTKIFLFLLFFSTTLLQAQIINIPDSVFKSMLIEEDVDTNDDGEIQVSEALEVLNLNISPFGGDPKIENLEGIQYFTNLISLDFSRNLITTFDASIYPNLDYLKGYGNNLSSVNLNGLNNLTYLNLRANDLTNIDLNSLSNLDILFLGSNNLINVNLQL